MIWLRLAGGLGNQLFEFGYALLLSDKYNQKILIDEHALNKYKEKRINYLKTINKYNVIYNNKISMSHLMIILRLPKLFKNNASLISDANNIKYLYYKTKNKICDGYFQNGYNQNNFNDMVTIIKKYINISNTEYNKKYYDNRCVIHIRGNDFNILGWNKILPKNYYLDSIKLFTDQNNIFKYDIITDDIEYAKSIIKEIKHINIKILKKNDALEDFKQIGFYKYRILSGSTFSIWASILGKNQGGRVVCPKQIAPNVIRTYKIPDEI